MNKPNSNPRVFLDISINKGPSERLIIELFADVVPITAENFRALCVGDKGIGSTTGKPLHYKGCIFHDITKGLAAQGGDFSNQNGKGGESIYGKTFPDENFKLRHSGPGILSMANAGPNRNGSQFLISFRRNGLLDGGHVVFGKVIRGIEIVQDIEQMGTGTGKPKGRVEITDCGEISQDQKSNVIKYNIPQSSSGNPRVFLDISINNNPPERLVIELFADVVPKTAENFRALCVGDKGIGSTTGKPLHYKGCIFHDITKGLAAQGGDFSNQNGEGGESIYGKAFPDENFKLDHSGPGILSMANVGPNRNGSQFLLTFGRIGFLDGFHVVFGKVIRGIQIVQDIEQMRTGTGKPKGRVEITDCGEISQDKKSNVIESDIPQSSSVRKEESEANLQKKYESATLKNNVLVTASDDREVTFEKPHQHSDDPSKPNPCVFLDISINKSPPERLVIELFADVVPKTAGNFRALCVGDKGNGIKTGKPLHYKGCLFYQIIKGFFAQGGDFSNQNGTGGESIYGETFPDENFKLLHTGRGILSMTNDGRNTNGSRFYITFSPQLFLDGYHVVFGKVIEGMETLENVEQLGTNSGTPLGPVEITDCGEIPLDVIKSGRYALRPIF